MSDTVTISREEYNALRMIAINAECYIKANLDAQMNETASMHLERKALSTRLRMLKSMELEKASE